MKNDQKNPIYPSVLFSCMTKQVNLMFNAEQGKHFKGPCLSLKFESLIQICSNPSGLVALAQHTHIAMFHACIILLHIVW